MSRTGLLGLVLLVVSMAMILSLQPALPRCEEDQALVGYGDFEHGRWSAYACGPAVDAIR